MAEPSLHAWRAVRRVPCGCSNSKPKKDDPDPKALCCDGCYGPILTRCSCASCFVQGRPVSQVTEDFLSWICERLAAEGR